MRGYSGYQWDIDERKDEFVVRVRDKERRYEVKVKFLNVEGCGGCPTVIYSLKLLGTGL